MEQKLSPNDSISIIEKALSETNKEKTGASYYYILWGTVMTLYFILQYLVLTTSNNYSNTLATIAWLLFPIGGILSFIQSKKTDKTEKIKTLNERVYIFVWGGTGLCLGIMGFSGYLMQPKNYVTMVLLLFGFASFVTGGVTRFTASIIGGVICVICAGLSFHFSQSTQFLIGALGVFSACVVPGIVMRKTKTLNV